MFGWSGRRLRSRSTAVTRWPGPAKNSAWRPAPAARSRTVAAGATRPADWAIQGETGPLASSAITPHHPWHSPIGSAKVGIASDFMILYRLRCSAGHEFESWFKDSKTYERQEKKSLIGCAVCGDSKVERAIMAPRLGKGGKDKPVEVQAGVPAPAPVPSPQEQQMAALARHMPKELREALTKVREQVEKNCEHVGNKFAEEARKIHYGESEKRGIYGQ